GARRAALRAACPSKRGQLPRRDGARIARRVYHIRRYGKTVPCGTGVSAAPAVNPGCQLDEMYNIYNINNPKPYAGRLYGIKLGVVSRQLCSIECLKSRNRAFLANVMDNALSILLSIRISSKMVCSNSFYLGSSR